MSHDTLEQQIIHLLSGGADIIECPPINQRIMFGFPATDPIVWVNDKILNESDSAQYAEVAHESDQIELVDFKGQNGLTYYRYTLAGKLPL